MRHGLAAIRLRPDVTDDDMAAALTAADDGPRAMGGGFGQPLVQTPAAAESGHDRFLETHGV